MGFFKALKNGIIDENPTFIQVLGMCPTLATTTSAINGLGMGLSATVVLALSNLLTSLLKKIIPSKIITYLIFGIYFSGFFKGDLVIFIFNYLQQTKMDTQA